VGEDAPNFTVNANDVNIDLYEFLKDSWGIIFNYSQTFVG
jgi:alkyl hydroperoxide reductase subunit AhpC